MQGRGHGASPRNEAPQDVRTGLLGNVSAVSIDKCSTAAQTLSNWKAHAVDLLSEVFEIEPALASAWAHAIDARFPWYRGA
jgi:hypothetical protein